jgi:hypothetical protein
MRFATDSRERFITVAVSCKASFAPAFLALPHNLPRLVIFSQPDELRMSQMTSRRPFGELDLGNQLSSRTEYGPRQPALRFDRWRIGLNRFAVGGRGAPIDALSVILLLLLCHRSFL